MKIPFADYKIIAVKKLENRYCRGFPKKKLRGLYSPELEIKNPGGRLSPPGLFNAYIMF